MLRVAARNGWAEFRTAYPTSVLLSLMLPRVVFQMAFLTLLGGFASQDGERFAFIGASVQIVTLGAVVYAGMSVTQERNDGTGAEVRLSRVPVALVRVVRCWVYVAEGVAFFLVGTLVLGAVLGYSDLSLRLLALLPVYLLAGVSMLGFGLAAATLSPAGLETVLLNVVNSTWLVVGGAVIPLSNLGAFAGLSHVLPGVNALLAIRASIDGEPVTQLVIAECGVAALWLAAAVAADKVMAARVRRGLSARTAGG